MYSVTNDYKAAIYNTPIYSKLAGTITLTDGNTISIYDNSAASNIVKGSVCITNQCYSKNKLEYGNAYVGQLEISLYNDIDRNVLYGGVITLSWYLKLANGTYEEIPLGVFIISQAVRTKRIVKITAYDRMQLLDKEFLSTETSGSIYAILTYIANITGVELEQTEDEIEALTNGSRYIVITEGMGYSTYRDIISDIATMLCSFATMTRDGKLKFVQYGTADTVAEVIPAGKRNNTDIAEKVINYDTVTYSGKKTKYTVVKSGQETGTSVFAIEGTPIIYQNHAREYITVTLQSMVDKISTLSYTPISCNIVANPALDLGDYITFTTGSNTEAAAPVMFYKWKYHGSMTIKAVGENTTTGESKTSKIAAGAADEVASNDTVIYTYENARPYTLNTDYKQIIRLDFVSMKATKGLFHAQIIVTNEADTVITFKYVYNNSADIYFMPSQTLAAGSHIITLFYPLNAIPENTANSLRVQAILNDGTADIAEYGIKAAVTAQGLVAGAAEWDGSIEIEETFTNVMLSGISVKPLAESVATATKIPTKSSITEAFTPILLSGISIRGFAEEIGGGEPKFIIERAIVEFAGNEYTTRSEGRTVLQNTYVYTSEAEEIDSGSLCGVTVITSDKASVEGITFIETEV